MKVFTLCAALLFTPYAFAPCAFADDTSLDDIRSLDEIITVKPGQWESRLQLTMSASPLLSDSDSYCVTKQNSSRIVASLMDDIADIVSCGVSNLTHGEGALEADVVCVFKDTGAKAIGHIVGEYTDVSYALSANAALDLNGLQLPAKAVSTAKWVGPCAPKSPKPAPEKASENPEG